MEWHKFIRLIKEELGVSVAEFAEILGISSHTVNSWLYKKSPIPMKLYQEIFYLIHANIPQVKKLVEDKRERKRESELNVQLQEIKISRKKYYEGKSYELFKLLQAIFKKNSND